MGRRARENTMIKIIGLIAAVLLPLWNIPLIMRIIQRRSSMDISLWWALGVWVCMVFLVPSGLMSSDIVWKVFTIVNFCLFSIVVITILRYRQRKN